MWSGLAGVVIAIVRHSAPLSTILLAMEQLSLVVGIISLVQVAPPAAPPRLLTPAIPTTTGRLRYYTEICYTNRIIYTFDNCVAFIL